MLTPRPKVRCERCERRTNRMLQEDGTYGHCVTCGGRLVRTEQTAERRLARARAEVAEFEDKIARSLRRSA